MILFGLFDLIYYLSVKFVMCIVKQKLENKRNLFLKTAADAYSMLRISLSDSENQKRRPSLSREREREKGICYFEIKFRKLIPLSSSSTTFTFR